MSNPQSPVAPLPVSPPLRFVLWLGAVCALGGLLSSAFIPTNHAPPVTTANSATATPRTSYSSTAHAIDLVLAKQAVELKLSTAAAASPLTIMRRAALGLRGSIPSLAEIRQWEALPEEQRFEWWIDHLLSERVTADYLAERFARAWVGVENTPLILFRRRRLVTWTSDQLLANRPYDQIMRELIAAEGVWTDHPAANFLTHAILPEDQVKVPQPNHLASTTARAFLGVRLDCAECHDHPFDERWRQRDYQQLAAFFGQARLSIRGIADDPRAIFRVEDRKTLAKEVVLPQVPYGLEWLPTHGSRREQLAAWITDHRNPLPARALANRLWAILFGRPLVDPVDDLPIWDLARQPTGKKELHLKEVAAEQMQPTEQILDILAKDLLAHDYDWQRTVRIIMQTAAFQRASEQNSSDIEPTMELRPQPEQYWAEFPLTRLRPEQIIGALTQAANLRSLDEQANIVTRLTSYAREADFVKRYGDAGADEFLDRSGTIPQSLLLMNNNLVQSILRPDLMNASHRIAKFSTSPAQAIELTYLALLTRRPTTVEAEHFQQRWHEERALGRQQLVADLYWTILNSTEFRWNH